MSGARSDDEFNSFFKKFMDTCTVKKKDENGNDIVLVRDPLAFAAWGYISRQLNDVARLTKINEKEYGQMLMEMTDDLIVEIYINHYDDYDDPVEADPLCTSTVNLIRLLLSKIKHGIDVQMEIEEIRSKQPLQMAQR